MSIRETRKEYALGALDEDSVGNDPLKLFQQWLDAAIAAELPEPNAVALSTVDEDGRPSSRIVLLRGFGPGGFEFYTNYRSRKARGMESNAFASLLFFWQPLERQVRIGGTVTRLSEAESDEYFQKRPFKTRLGAIASQQSEELPDRATLERAVEQLENRYSPHDDVPRPAHWGGYRVSPDEYEFWQGRPSRLHDRFRFTLQDDSWVRKRLWP